MLSQAGLQRLQCISIVIYGFPSDQPGHDLHISAVKYMEPAGTHCIMIEKLYSNPEEMTASQLMNATEHNESSI